MVEIRSFTEEELNQLEHELDTASWKTALNAIRYLRNGLFNQRKRAEEAIEQRDMAQKAKRKAEQALQHNRDYECEALDFVKSIERLLFEGNWI